MIWYALLITQAILCSFMCFSDQKYAKHGGNTWHSSIIKTFYGSAIAAVLFFIISGFSIEFTPFALACGAAISVLCVLCNYASVKSFESANLSLYSMFMMLGCMIIPTAYGIIFLKEGVTVPKIVCTVLIIVAIVITLDKNAKLKAKDLISYAGVFILNGLVAVGYKFQQTEPELCVNTPSILFIVMVFNVLFAAVLLLIDRPISFKVNKLGFAALSAFYLLNGVGNFLGILVMEHLPASVQYPFFTGGVIVITTVISFIKREKIGVRGWIATAIAFAASVVMAF